MAADGLGDRPEDGSALAVLAEALGRHRIQVLKAVYVMLSTRVDYRGPGAFYLDAVDARRVSGNFVLGSSRLEAE